ncbi:MAG: hypothetical protein WAN43_08720 [Rhodomicrobium sp.]
MNADTLFKDFVQRQQKPHSGDEAMDWSKERDNWLDYLEKLYARIAEYLDEYIKGGTIKLRYSTIELNEENIGAYKAKRLTVAIGAQEIVFTPVGTLLIGSKGRVDVQGSAGNSRLVLIDKNLTNPKQMFRVTVTTIPPGGSKMPSAESAPSPKEIEWAWKIVSRPPSMQFTELNKETLFELLMEVSNG